MESRNLFEDRKIQRNSQGRPVWVVLLLSSLFPGIGHFFVGKVPLGLGLFFGLGVLTAGAAAAQFSDHSHVAWLLGRLATLTGLFAVIDATLFAAEQRDGRRWKRVGPPRWIAFLNLGFYGAGYWRMGERGLAALGLLTGLGLHVFLGSSNLPMAILAELAVSLLALHGYRMAQELAYSRPKQNLLGEVLDDRPRDTTPEWVMPALGIMGGVVFLTFFAAHLLQGTLEKAIEVRQDHAVVMEPYYRNPDYDVSLEMNAPGWSFGRTASNDFVVAQHVSEDTQMRLSVQPRLPGLNFDQMYANAAFTTAVGRGYSLQVIEAGPCQVAGHDGYRIFAEGTHGPSARRVVVQTTAKGWQQYVLWYEWGPSHDRFARYELNYLLAHLSLDGIAAPVSQKADDGSLAR